MPLRPAIAHLDRAAHRAQARADFGLEADRPTLLVTGGSQGAQAINAALLGAADQVRSSGIQVLHIAGTEEPATRPGRRRPLRRRPVRRPHGSGLLRRRLRGLPVRSDDLRRARGGRPARRVRPIAVAGWRATPQRRADRRGGRRTARGQRGADARLDHGRDRPDHDEPGSSRDAWRPPRRARARGMPTSCWPEPCSPRPERPSQTDASASARPTKDATSDRPFDWSAPGAALVRSAATDVVPPLADLGRVHIMGIAGAGMSGLARILLARGVSVSGCEARESATVAALRAGGATVLIGHSPAPPRRRRQLRLHDRDQPEAPRVRRGARQRQAVPAPRRRARRRARRTSAASPSPARTARRPRPRC